MGSRETCKPQPPFLGKAEERVVQASGVHGVGGLGAILGLDHGLQMWGDRPDLLRPLSTWLE
jgi:hypothetical protein